MNNARAARWAIGPDRCLAQPEFLGGDQPGAGLIGDSVAMSDLRRQIRLVSRSVRPVLITGPTGSGKELVARAIHRAGMRPGAPLIDLNCGAIPHELIESELFGHERGAFTGADRRHPGVFQLAGGGTLFLDEVGELPPLAQARLLRVLETRRFRPVGASTDQGFEGRVVAATHRDLRRAVAEGSFREDLFFRLSVLVVRAPALEDRREDIPALVAHFLAEADRRLNLTPEAMATLADAAWPGNVRQLRNVIDRLVVFAETERVTPAMLAALSPADDDDDGDDLRRVARAIMRLPHPDKLEVVEQAVAAEAMASSGGNKSLAARRLGIDRKALERRLSAAAGPLRLLTRHPTPSLQETPP